MNSPTVRISHFSWGQKKSPRTKAASVEAEKRRVSERRSAAQSSLAGSAVQRQSAAQAIRERPEDFFATMPPNPLWPGGVSEQMVEMFVEEILNDKELNIGAIPDVIERQIYLSTVRLALNTIYWGISTVHGKEILAGHKLLMQRIEDEGDEKASWRSNALASLTGSLDNEELGRMAERLLANRAVNQPLVPDFVERQLYINCLKLLFRLLDALTTTLRITVCGHDLKLVFEPVRKDDERRSSLGSDLRERVKKVSLSLTPVNLAAVAAYAREAGGVPQQESNPLYRWFVEPMKREMLAQLHTTLYALVLGTIDDMLENTVLTFLSDRIRLDVVCRAGGVPPVAEESDDAAPRRSSSAPTVRKSPTRSTSSPRGGEGSEAYYAHLGARGSGVSVAAAAASTGLALVVGVGIGVALKGRR